MKAKFGEFILDRSGLFHYEPLPRTAIPLAMLARDALAYRPSAPAWFWYEGIPAPIFADDDEHSLVQRWFAWQTAGENGHMLSRLQNLLLGCEE